MTHYIYPEETTATNYDALTGLPNLTYFFKLCEKKKLLIIKENKQACLIYIDLNGMKYYNEQNGFAQGDVLLKEVSELLANSFGVIDCCHIGADRFAVIMTEENIQERIEQLFYKFEKQEPQLTMRVGIYSTGVEDVPVTIAYDRAKLKREKYE